MQAKLVKKCIETSEFSSGEVEPTQSENSRQNDQELMRYITDIYANSSDTVASGKLLSVFFLMFVLLDWAEMQHTEINMLGDRPKRYEPNHRTSKLFVAVFMELGKPT